MLENYIPIAILIILAVGLAVLFVVLSHALGPKRPSQVKLDPYECGIEPVGDARSRFTVKYYLTALVFVLFDIETVFLVPWAVIYRDALHNWNWGMFVFWEMLVFVVVLAIGLAYVWKKGALEWD